jgi:SAM-dependent methyltransferase
VVAIDWECVLAVAKENALTAGVDNRYSTIAGSAFEVDYGSDYDLILLTNFLHHFDMTTCEKLLEKVHAALAPNGRAVAVDFVPDAGRVSPPGSAAFCMTMLATTPHGDAYTYDEFKRMLGNAGFVRSELRPLVSNFQQMIISYKVVRSSRHLLPGSLVEGEEHWAWGRSIRNSCCDGSGPLPFIRA